MDAVHQKEERNDVVLPQFPHLDEAQYLQGNVCVGGDNALRPAPGAAGVQDHRGTSGGGARFSLLISCRPRRGAEGRYNPYSLQHLRRRPRRQMQWRLLGEYSHSGLRHRLADWDGNPHRRTISPSEQRHATRWFGQEGQEGQRLVPRLCCRCGEECPSRRSRVIARDDNRSSRPR